MELSSWTFSSYLGTWEVRRMNVPLKHHRARSCFSDWTQPTGRQSRFRVAALPLPQKITGSSSTPESWTHLCITEGCFWIKRSTKVLPALWGVHKYPTVLFWSNVCEKIFDTQPHRDRWLKVWSNSTGYKLFLKEERTADRLREWIPELVARGMEVVGSAQSSSSWALSPPPQ